MATEDTIATLKKRRLPGTPSSGTGLADGATSSRQDGLLQAPENLSDLILLEIVFFFDQRQ
jgi:hypothetical protein